TPFLEHVLCHLRSHGIDTAVLGMGHLSQSVVDYFGDGSRTGLKLVYSIEQQPLGTAGPVKLASQCLTERFLVLNGDIFADFDITAIVRKHVENKAIATLALIPVEDPSAYGVVEYDTKGRISRFIEKPKREEAPSNMINAGMYVMEPEALDYIPGSSKVMFEDRVFPSLLADQRPMYGVQHSGYWIDIGTPWKYLQLNLDLLNSTGAALSCPPRDTGKTSIDPSATVSGPVVLGEGTFVGPEAVIVGPAVTGPGVRLERGARLEHSVVWKGVELSEYCRVVDSVVANDTTIGSRALVESSAIIDNFHVDAGAILPAGTKVPKEGCNSLGRVGPVTTHG
ncbi:MAG: NDP-sugar synthase, partial [Chloroflexi bacterium]|nr:NDP-sugar synthase [Chloroflexota bacterium]